MVDWLVPHQANKRIIEATAERMGLPMETGDGDHQQIWQHDRGDDSALPVGISEPSSKPATGCCSLPSAAASPGAAST